VTSIIAGSDAHQLTGWLSKKSLSPFTDDRLSIEINRDKKF